MLKALPSDATIYARNESELGVAVGVADSLRSLAANVKFTENTLTENVPGVNGEISSAEGQVVRNSDGATVQIADVESASGGKLTVRLTDGSTANISELSFPNVGEQELWRVLAEYSDNAEDARQLLKEYRAGDLGAFEYAKGVEEGFIYGKLNIGAEEMSRRGSYVNLLNPMQKNMAYKYGQYAGEKQTKRQQEKIDGSKKRKKNKKGQLHYEGDRNKLTERQKVSLETCEIIAKALGVEVYVFESKKNAQGKRVGDNGWYDPKDGSIHIDLYAGENSEGVMAFTMAHELGHFIKDWSPTKFRTLSNFLAEQYGQKGLSVRDMVLLQQEKAETNGRKLTFEQAHEEWVCDSLETMLTDGAVLEKLAMLQAKDQSLVQKIKQFLATFLERLKAAYTGVSPQTKEGRIINEMVDAAQQLRDLFADALIDAGENYRSADKNTTGEGGVRFSAVRTSFATELQDWFDNTTHNERKTSGKRFLVGTTTTVLKSIGVKDYSIYFGGSKIDKILTDNESMTLKTIKDAVMLLEKPILIMESLTVDESIVLFGEAYTTGNKPVMISVLLNPKTKSGEILDYAVITSAYGRRNSNLQNLINNSKIYYVEPKKIEPIPG